MLPLIIIRMATGNERASHSKKYFEPPVRKKTVWELSIKQVHNVVTNNCPDVYKTIGDKQCYVRGNKKTPGPP